MNVAVVAKTQEEAVRVAARLGMTRASTPLSYGVSPLLGHRFTAVLVVDDPNFNLADRPWWDEVLERLDGPVYRLET